MSNGIYDSARVKLLTANLNWLTANLVLSAWSGVPDFVPTDSNISNIVARGHAERGSSLPVTGQAVAPDGTAQTGNVVIPALSIGPNITWMTFAIRNATYNLSELILYIDEAVELPFVANGLDFIITPDWAKNRGWWRP
jgi:hypothetical protein